MSHACHAKHGFPATLDVGQFSGAGKAWFFCIGIGVEKLQFGGLRIARFQHGNPGRERHAILGAVEFDAVFVRRVGKQLDLDGGNADGARLEGDY